MQGGAGRSGLACSPQGFLGWLDNGRVIRWSLECCLSRVPSLLATGNGMGMRCPTSRLTGGAIATYRAGGLLAGG